MGQSIKLQYIYLSEADDIASIRLLAQRCFVKCLSSVTKLSGNAEMIDGMMVMVMQRWLMGTDSG